MIDIRSLCQGLNITQPELARIIDITGIGRLRFAMAERRVVTLKPREEAIIRLAIAYTMHCRSVRLAERLSQGTLRESVPMTWDEYVAKHQNKTS